MQQVVSTWSEFRKHWDGVTNFLMEGECVPFSFDLPPVESVVDIVRNDPDARIWRGEKNSSLDKTDISEQFRALPIEEAIVSPFQMSHFKLENFYGKGQMLEGFEEQVLTPWKEALSNAGFTWTRCYPILFISGPHSATNYHMDLSHVLAWQKYGTKIFSGLKDPQRWAPLETRLNSSNGLAKPAEITEDDVLAYEMKPNTVLWNCFLTPHWVEASDQIAYSINISHGGLSLNGQLCQHEEELEAWRRQQEPVAV